MACDLKPVNRQAALFMSRKARVETIQEAMDAVATRISSPEFVGTFMQALIHSDEFPEIELRVQVRKDAKHKGQYSVALRQFLTQEGTRTHYYGLDAE